MADAVKYRCRTHGVECEVSGNSRTIVFRIDPRNPPGPCLLPFLKELKEGRSGDCEIVKV
ncbi:MAG: hypothetical protein QXP81_10840 [Nitrososphaerota archaeon]